MKEFDTICAIATALGEGGIAIIRISGDKALDIDIKIFKPKAMMILKYEILYYEVWTYLWCRN